MAVTIKSAWEIEKMRQAGILLARVHEELAKVIHPGVSTKEIDTVCELSLIHISEPTRH